MIKSGIKVTREKAARKGSRWGEEAAEEWGPLGRREGRRGMGAAGESRLQRNGSCWGE